ncbi:helix-turn-helix domain-containing protein [Lichenihabitans psoromatis]|uniref:helix-turn-helix domain-containing protein n=1 Tax=Lichenihabitans psoromatis TaxID=2528642 RepID=UPI001036D3DC|nr:helix-turn-helix transcriptional regulator [Lichenihabitans psoromatis]
MANNLRVLRGARGWSQEDAASALGTTRNQYGKLENGTRRLSDKWIERAAEAYGIDAGEIVRGKPIVVPIAGYVGAGAEMILFAEGQGNLGEVAGPDGTSDRTIAVEIKGESLGPFFNGWLVLFDDVRSPVTDDLIGRLCVVGLMDGRVLVKRLMKSRGPSSLFHLYGQFGDPILDIAVKWAAPVKTVMPR